MAYQLDKEIVLFGLQEHGDFIPEVKIIYDNSEKVPFKKILTSDDAADFIRQRYPEDSIEVQEQIIVLYLDTANKIKGYYRHSKGSINATIADIKLILAGAIQSISVGIIIAHNHPSGNTSPSEPDKNLTTKIAGAAKTMDIKFLDHIIISKHDHYSFADDGFPGLLGIDNIGNEHLDIESLKNKAAELRAKYSTDPDSKFTQAVISDLKKGIKHNKISLKKLAASFSIADQNKIKELTELAIVNIARAIVYDKNLSTLREKYDAIAKLYKEQPNLSHRTSQSVMLQQYSTPAPISFIAGMYAASGRENVKVFEPSAGNGLLTIAFPPGNVIVNEIDQVRSANLKTQGYKEVRNHDATEPFKDIQHKMDAIVTNPPFGTLDTPVNYSGFAIKTLDHLMALRALDTLKDDGRGAIIVGGHMEYDHLGRLKAGKNRLFFNYLYSHYNVEDVINIDGHDLYSRQGTSFDVRLILINGRKKTPSGAAPLLNEEFNKPVKDFDTLFERVYGLFGNESMSGPYIAESEACTVLNTIVPDSMDFETKKAIQKIKARIGGSIDAYVIKKLGYKSSSELCKALSAEQTDAVAMAIYNIEKGQGMIIGDQTGIGKGRIAASVIRYAVLQGLQPIFLTEKANLFSDLYRDLIAIGSGDLVPFIVNSQESKTDIKDESGEILFKAPAKTEQDKIIKDKKIPAKYKFMLGTYTQFNSPESKPGKPNFLLSVAKDNVLILDESHNASGSSNTGEFLQSVISHAKGVTFLSATFAKRPDNMPVYAMKTAISEANMSKEDLVAAITSGGVSLQEILASQLVAEGQMLRRERSFEGVEVNYIILDQLEQEHRAISDNITDILRDIISFQVEYVDEELESIDKIMAAEGKEIRERGGTSEAGISNPPAFSKVFQVIYQMLFSIKAEAVADRAIERLREGLKPVIAFTSTMGSFLEQMEHDDGQPVKEGDKINADFVEVLQKGLKGVLRYTEIGHDGKKKFGTIKLEELAPEAQIKYQVITEKIKLLSSGISISPIDIIIQKIEKAGFSVAEVTGRKLALEINSKNQGVIKARKKINTNDAFRQFNNNQVDVLLINQSGSTGASAHAIVTPLVPKEKVKQRVMIVLQAELNINTEVQKRGRINRTGQILPPVYDYINSAIPAEKRLMMMLQQKLKSLDANTSSNQKQSNKILDVEDFLNKYGDQVVMDWLKENPEINEMIGDPMKLNGEEDEPEITDAAHKVSGRVAVLSTKVQDDFYTEVARRYNDLVEYLKQSGDYDLEVANLNLQAKTISKTILIAGKGGESAFGRNSILETVEANILRKPYTKKELENILKDALSGKTAKEVSDQTILNYETYSESRLNEDLAKNELKYKELLSNVSKEKRIVAIKDPVKRSEAIKERTAELEEARESASAKLADQLEYRKNYILRQFRFFKVGDQVKYVIHEREVDAIFLGFIIDSKRANPYTPSAYKLRFALASSEKYLAVPGSNSKVINEVMASSFNTRKSMDLLENWDSITKKYVGDRGIRNIVTGNVLQAFAGYKGSLVSYTTIDGGIKKGILLPESFNVEDGVKGVTVPIGKALPVIKALPIGQSIQTVDNVGLIRQGESFRVIVDGSKSKGGKFFLDKDILDIVNNKIFEKVSGKMMAYVEVEKIDKLVKILQTKFNSSVPLTPSQFDIIKKGISIEEYDDELQPAPLNNKENTANDLRIRLAKAKAKALKLKYQYASQEVGSLPVFISTVAGSIAASMTTHLLTREGKKKSKKKGKQVSRKK